VTAGGTLSGRFRPLKNIAAVGAVPLHDDFPFEDLIGTQVSKRDTFQASVTYGVDIGEQGKRHWESDSNGINTYQLFQIIPDFI
jgi:hypothetical protein